MSDPKTSGKYSKYLIRLLLTVNTLIAIFYYSFLAFLRDYASSSVSTLDIVFALGSGTMVFIGTFLLHFSIIYVLIATLYFLYSFIRQMLWFKRPTTVRRLPRAVVLRPKVTLGTSILIMIMAVIRLIP
ncbi:MAG: hypothetical protein GKR77_03390 [Legionellales bacterium]|nr:hypothetical protein [Legionellales bacterium]